ncbi:MAG: metallophosphoesterase [Clostridia bacterium]|nr:metallophosphoesterase [Clostridia bacterium]
MAILKLVVAFFVCFPQIISPLFLQLTKGEEQFFTDWSADVKFSEADYITIEKDPNEDFVILNLTDIQLGEENVFGDDGAYSFELIRKLVNDLNPDLITLSGDNAWGYISYLETIELLESFNIPWAPVMGNHDGEGTGTEFWAAYTLSNAKNCLFQFGPAGMGYGNYIINVTENDKIIHTLFMMDTHGYGDFVLEDGTVAEDGYDHLWDNQQEWYKWAVNGIKDINGGNIVESTVIFHIPVREYLDAWSQISVGETEEELGTADTKNKLFLFGNKTEQSCPSPVNNGFFALCKELGSTKNILVGHDHVNDFSVMYDGIRLSYSLKSGFCSYWTDEMIGGTTLNINSKGNLDIEHHYYDLQENNWDVTDD